jgi:hypothetical protein
VTISEVGVEEIDAVPFDAEHGATCTTSQLAGVRIFDIPR